MEHVLTKAQGLGPAPAFIACSFATNGSSDPVTTTRRYPVGCPFTVTHSATGTYLVTFPQGCGTPAQVQAIIPGAQFDVAADWFDVGAVAETSLNTATRQFTIFTHRNGTATDVAANAGSRVNFAIFFDNSTGS